MARFAGFGASAPGVWDHPEISAVGPHARQLDIASDLVNGALTGPDLPQCCGKPCCQAVAGRNARFKLARMLESVTGPRIETISAAEHGTQT